jgi:hypothetical protein
MRSKLSIILFLILVLNISTLSAQSECMNTIIEDLNPELFNKDFTGYDQNTAIYCAQLSEVAYWDTGEVSELIADLNRRYPDFNHKYRFLEDKESGTQLIFFATRQYLIIAFRGTEFEKEFKDIVLDGKFFRYYQDSGYSDLPAGHGGFRRGIMNLMDRNKIFAELREFQSLCNINHESDFPVYTTGHSLGAALATLIIEPLHTEQFNFSGCYNFAPPLAIELTETPELFAKYNSTVYDIVNYLDYVTRAGNSGRIHLGRIGKFYRICENGIINNEDEKRDGRYVSHRWRTKFRLYKFHKLSGYLDGVKNTKNSNEDIIKRKEDGTTCF